MLSKAISLILSAAFIFLFSCDTFEDLPKEESLDSWEIFNLKTGLKSNNIWCLKADSKGNIWAGTVDQGLMKFDGENWTNYSTAHGLPSNYVSSIDEYFTGELWIGTTYGFSIFDGESFTNYTGTDPVYAWRVTAIKTLENGDIWMGTADHGLFKLSGSKVSEYSFQSNQDANWITSIDQSSDGTIWAGTYGGLYKIKNAKVEFLNSQQGLASDTVTAVFCDSWGETWIGNYNSEFITRYEDGNFREFSLFNSQYFALTNSFAEDKRGNIWMGLVSEGVVRYDGIATKSFSVEDGLPGMSILDIEIDTSGCIWFASHYNGIAKYTPGL